MREDLKKKCDLFIENKEIIKDAFPFGSAPTSGAILLAGNDKLADYDRLKELNKILKENEGIFSSLRSHLKDPVICKMALVDDPEAYVTNLRHTFNELNKNRILSNEYDVVTAMVLDQMAEDDVSEYIDKTFEIFQLMKKDHLFQTSGEDMPFAAILASSDKPVEELMKDAEQCYDLLRKRFPLSGAVQSLSYVLAMNPATPEEKADKTIRLFDAYKDEGLKYGKSYELASLGALVALDMSVEDIVAETREAYDYIEEHNGYGMLESSKESRVMNASMLVLMSHKDIDPELESVALSAQLSIILAIELAVILVTTSIITSQDD